MVSRLRIARLDPSAYTPVGSAAPTAATHRRLIGLVRAHLPPVSASLFALPAPSADGRVVEWYSDLAGQPTALRDLPHAERERVRILLNDRLASLAHLVERLRHDASGEAPAAELDEALSYPGEETVYAIGGQPVLTFWGHRRVDAPPARPPVPAPRAAPFSGPTVRTEGRGAPTGAAEPATVPPRRVAAWLWMLLLLCVLLLGAYFGNRFLGWGERGPDYAALLLAARGETAKLHERMAALEAALGQRLEICAAGHDLAAAQAEAERLASEVERLQRDLADRLALCPVRQQLDTARAEGETLRDRAARLEHDLAKAIAICQRKAQPTQRPTAPTAPPTVGPQAAAPTVPGQVPPTPRCPGERPKEEAPDVAIVLDASGSMRLPASLQASQIAEGLRGLGAAGGIGGIVGVLGSIVLQQASGPSRLDEAKKGVTSVLRSLPDDVDVGMTVLARCPRADNLGFFSGAQRGALAASVAQLEPMQGTPLAQGVEDAGAMIDGVTAPAVLVVVSDGEDSCGGDPCAVARALKAQKPQLTINVVDILGNGVLACMAEATGGKVLKPEDGLAFERTIQQAAAEAQKPAYCP